MGEVQGDAREAIRSNQQHIVTPSNDVTTSMGKCETNWFLVGLYATSLTHPTPLWAYFAVNTDLSAARISVLNGLSSMEPDSIYTHRLW